MGVRCFGGSTCSSSPYAVVDSNPDPQKFVIVNESYVNGFLVLHVRYPNCTNFEGNKLLVYRHIGITSSQSLLKKTGGKLDPHFSSGLSPVARFIPNEEGLLLCERMINP